MVIDGCVRLLHGRDVGFVAHLGRRNGEASHSFVYCRDVNVPSRDGGDSDLKMTEWGAELCWLWTEKRRPNVMLCEGRER